MDYVVRDQKEFFCLRLIFKYYHSKLYLYPIIYNFDI